MSKYMTGSYAFMLVGMSFVGMSCSRQPARMSPPAINAAAAGALAIEMFDNNKDGLRRTELDKCPGLKAAIANVDPSKQGITAEAIGVLPGALRAAEPPSPGRRPATGSFTLWQLPSQTGSQIMSYVIQSPNGHLIVVDGGFEGDAPYLRYFLTTLGGKVDAWFISHQHIDHIGAITAILTNMGGLAIENIYGSLLSEEWIQKYDHRGNDSNRPARDLNAALKASGKRVSSLAEGQEINIDGLRFEVLQAADEGSPSENAVNNQSVVLRLSTPGTSVLFLGDLGVEGGERLLKGKSAEKLSSEYVQMAHHGQAGVDRPVYAAIKAKYALWPTPDWLWTWDTTKEVRGWMKELGVQENYVLMNGLIELNLPMTAAEVSHD